MVRFLAQDTLLEAVVRKRILKVRAFLFDISSDLRTIVDGGISWAMDDFAFVTVAMRSLPLPIRPAPPPEMHAKFQILFHLLSRLHGLASIFLGENFNWSVMFDYYKVVVAECDMIRKILPVLAVLVHRTGPDHIASMQFDSSIPGLSLDLSSKETPCSCGDPQSRETMAVHSTVEVFNTMWAYGHDDHDPSESLRTVFGVYDGLHEILLVEEDVDMSSFTVWQHLLRCVPLTMNYGRDSGYAQLAYCLTIYDPNSPRINHGRELGYLHNSDCITEGHLGWGALLRDRDPSAVQSLLGGNTSRRVDCQHSRNQKLGFVRCRTPLFLVELAFFVTNLIFTFLTSSS
jgi:hypothetical protein